MLKPQILFYLCDFHTSMPKQWKESSAEVSNGLGAKGGGILTGMPAALRGQGGSSLSSKIGALSASAIGVGLVLRVTSIDHRWQVDAEVWEHKPVNVCTTG